MCETALSVSAPRIRSRTRCSGAVGLVWVGTVIVASANCVSSNPGTAVGRYGTISRSLCSVSTVSSRSANPSASNCPVVVATYPSASRRTHDRASKSSRIRPSVACDASVASPSSPRVQESVASNCNTATLFSDRARNSSSDSALSILLQRLRAVYPLRTVQGFHTLQVTHRAPVLAIVKFFINFLIRIRPLYYSMILQSRRTTSDHQYRRRGR